MSIRSMSRSLLAATALAATAACHDHADITVASARVEVLNSSNAVVQTVTVTPNNASGNLVLTRGVGATVRVTWLDATGAADPANTDSDFEVRFSPPSGSGLSWTLASGSRTQGTMTGTTLQASPVQVGMQLYHTAERHSDFDVRVPVTVVAPVVTSQQ